jgi:hypothetical protein
MTKQERKLKHMLNYFEISSKGSKDEKLNKKEITKFLDTFWRMYDLLTVQEIVDKIKQKRKDETPLPFDNEDEDFNEEFNEDSMFPSEEDTDDTLFNKETKSNESNTNFNDPISTDINKFLRWLTLILYSGNHSVIISEDINGIFIKLIKINKDKGKK